MVGMPRILADKMDVCVPSQQTVCAVERVSVSQSDDESVQTLLRLSTSDKTGSGYGSLERSGCKLLSTDSDSDSTPALSRSQYSVGSPSAQVIC